MKTCSVQRSIKEVFPASRLAAALFRRHAALCPGCQLHLRQVQQLAQGLIALVGLSGNQNPDVQALAQSCTISTSGPTVSIAATLPTADLIRKLSESK